MIDQSFQYETDSPLRYHHRFRVGDRVETCSHCVGTVVRVDIDEVGVFIVVRLNNLPGEFAYDPYDLEILQ